MIALQIFFVKLNCHGSKVMHVTEHAHKIEHERICTHSKQKYRKGIEYKGWKQQRLRRVQLQVRYKEKELWSMLDNPVQTPGEQIKALASRFLAGIS